ncbi:MAG TPA: cache domain-containing protein [bacterium]
MIKISLRTKLLVSLVSVILISGVISTVAGVRLIGNDIIKQAQDKVRTDLNSAREIYNELLKDAKNITRFTSTRVLVRDAVVKNDRQYLVNVLAQVLKSENLDILIALDAGGRVITRANNPSVYGDDLSSNALLQRVINDRLSTATTILLAENQLQREGDALVRQAAIEILHTPMAKYQRTGIEKNGMAVAAATPVFDDDQRMVGIIYGAKLLNHNYDLVDQVKNTVFQDEKYKGKDIGTATIFQGDLRISTNVKNEDGSRAIGTLVSQSVYEAVLERGERWIARAFVVNDWYITAYEPIRDINNNVTGILYVGILEQKYTDMRNNVILTFLGITLLGMVVVFFISFMIAQGIVRPVARLATAAHHIADGDFSYSTNIQSSDEIGELGKVFNFMVTSISERDAQIRELAQLKIAEAERLAMIGQLAAGVAHEINNPLTGIILYCDLVLRSLPKGDPKRTNLEKINAEALRCKNIVRGLLDFARQKKPEIKDCSVNQLLEASLSLIKSQALFLNITIDRILDETLPMVKVDPSQIQQVFMNIIINAGEAMEGKGELSVRTALSKDRKFVEVTFADTGPGIKEENIKKIFEPFFTTKEATHGVGLGLSISHRIIEDNGGKISVTSEIGKGTTFVIRLPC